MLKTDIDSFVIDSRLFTIVNQEPIGRGGNAEVYLVADEEGNEYAAKVGLSNFESHKDEKNFMRELVILSKVNNPCTIGLKGYTLNPCFKGDELDSDKKKIQYPTFLLEKAAQGSLRSKLAPHQLQSQKSIDPNWTPTKRMISIAGIAFGMKSLHAKHIIHRDLKPENILLNENLHPKITDFGLSKIQHDKQQSLFNQGTVPYMAPEIFEDDPTYTNSVDVYAFSIMAYEIITLKKLYPNVGNQFQIMRQVSMGKRPEFPDDVNPLLKQLICRGWEYQDTLRPTFEEIFELLKKPEYLIPDVDLKEYNEYINSLNDESEPLCLESEVKNIVNQAQNGDTQKMLEAANGFYEGRDQFPYNEDHALHFYRLYSLAMSKSHQKVSDDKLIQELPSEVKNIISTKQTPDELFDLSIQFKEGNHPFPQSYQLSSYFSSKAFEALRSTSESNETPQKIVESTEDVKIEECPKEDVKVTKEDEDDEEEDESSQQLGDQEVNFVPICTQILISKLSHISVLIYGQNAAVSPIINALTTKQNIIEAKCDDRNFNCSRIHGKGIFIYYPKDCDSISANDVLQFIRRRQSSSNLDDKLFMCLYCVSPSLEHDSNDTQIINDFSKLVYTTVFVTSVEKKSVVEKIKRKIKGRIYKREKMVDSKKLRKSTLIFDVKLYPQNSHSNLVQEFVDIVPRLSII